MRMSKLAGFCVALICTVSTTALAWDPDTKFGNKFNQKAKSFGMQVEVSEVGCDRKYVRQNGMCYWSFYREHEIQQTPNGWKVYSNYKNVKESKEFLTVFFATVLPSKKNQAQKIANRIVDACNKSKSCFEAIEFGSMTVNADINGIFVFQSEGNECDGCE